MSSFKICGLMSALLIFSLLTFVHIGCGKDPLLSQQAVSNTNVQDRSYNAPLDFAADCGRLHNEGLDNMVTTISPSSTYANTTLKVSTLLSNSLSYLNSYEDIDFSGVDVTDLQDGLAIIDNSKGFTSSSVANTWKSYRNSISITQKVSNNELLYVDDLNAFFNNGLRGLTKAEACAAIITKCNNLMADFNNHTWANNEGTLAYGLLATTKGSAQYWSTHGSTDDGQTAAILVNIDAAGFLVGWGIQLYNDIQSPNDCSDPSNRIGAGLHGAICASGGLALRLWSM